LAVYREQHLSDEVEAFRGELSSFSLCRRQVSLRGEQLLAKGFQLLDEVQAFRLTLSSTGVVEELKRLRNELERFLPHRLGNGTKECRTLSLGFEAFFLDRVVPLLAFFDTE
jgi:hypothetical protein